MNRKKEAEEPRPEQSESMSMPPPPPPTRGAMEFYSELPTFPSAMEESDLLSPPLESIDMGKMQRQDSDMRGGPEQPRMQMQPAALQEQRPAPRPMVHHVPKPAFSQMNLEQEAPLPPIKDIMPEFMKQPPLFTKAPPIEQQPAMRAPPKKGVYHLERPYVEASRFQVIMNELSEFRRAVNQFSTITADIEKLDDRREKSFSAWQADLELIQQKLFAIDEMLFNPQR